MPKEEIYLSREGYEKLIKEVQYLRTVRQRDLSKAIGEARDLGDLSENADYHAAREAQALNQKRIKDIEYKLSMARILEEQNIPKDTILIGATVNLKNMDTGDEIEYTLVSGQEADFETGKISVDSPVGSTLLGHKENEEVTVKVRAGNIRYKVLKISRKY